MMSYFLTVLVFQKFYSLKTPAFLKILFLEQLIFDCEPCLHTYTSLQSFSSQLY